jgi:3-hydroxyacyl-CoA dehydrogenase
MSTQYEVRGPVAVITLNNPPVNGWSLAMRVSFVAQLDQAQADPAVKAIVVTGAGNAFCGGADIREFGSTKALQDPNLPTVLTYTEACAKPVIAAVHSVALGGGMELVMACHYRIAAPGTIMGMPEVKLGLLPGATGTARLPRLVGVETALNMVVNGDPLKSEAVFALPGQKLIDRMATSKESLLDEALAYAAEVADVRPIPRVRELPCQHPNAEAYFQFARNTVKAVAKDYPAPLACVEAIANAVKLPYDKAVAEERKFFITLMNTPECRALRNAFLGERACSKIPDVPDDTPTRKIQSVAVIGAGTMGSGIAINFLMAGLPVTLIEAKAEALERGAGLIRKHFEDRVKKDRMLQDKAEQLAGLLKPSLEFADMATADLVIEAVFEDMGVKTEVFKKIDALAKQGAILATNTSTLDVNAIANATARPQDVVGLHFFSPAQVMKLLEVVRGAATAKDVLSTVMGVAKKIKKTAVVSGVCDGFIGNRMVEQYIRQALFMVDEGASPEQIDKAIEKFGFAMGPFRMSDLAGNDIGWAIRKRRYVEQPQVRYAKTGDKLCELGRFGQKTGKGWYDYVPGQRKPVASAEVKAMIEAHRESIGIKPRKIGDEEIINRLVLALINEGAQILEEGISSKASDIDMVYLTGYGFPPFRGGPMCYANELGLFTVTETMKRLAQNPNDDAAFWQPAPLLQKLLADGKTL